ncbi:MAG TPA: glycoside hydrolase domain-containing protein [Planctomycetota bacterium]|nr:glycoside hydrolase domain-containing protein [Planctomycetota bacterium]
MILRSVALALAACASAAAADTVLLDFEGPGQAIENSDRIEIVAEHATQGKHAGKVRLDQAFNPNLFIPPAWRQQFATQERLEIDVFVEGAPVTAFGFVKDAKSPGWWERHNFEQLLAPGSRKLSLPIAALPRQNGKGVLDASTIEFIALAFKPAEEGGAAPTIWLDNGRLTSGASSAQALVLYSFDGKDAGTWLVEDWPEEFKGTSKAAAVGEHATDGAKALRLESAAPAGYVRFEGFAADWSTWDALAFDVFNPKSDSIEIGGWVRAGDAGSDWWNRYNWQRVIRPGMNTVRLSVGDMTGPNGGKPIDVSRIVGFNISADHATVDLDNVRLVKGVEEVAVAGLKRFDFGPATGAVMPGFAKMTRDSAFSGGADAGWQPGGQFGRDFDINEILGRHRPVDDLCRDFCMPIRATFSVALPDGTYGAWLMLAPPGAGWAPSFRHRTVAAEGAVVVDQRYDAKTFAAYEYRFQDLEDLPGDDLWSRYIDPLFTASVFEVEVKDGRLDLDFDAHGEWWSAMVNGLAVWPASSTAAAQRWLDGLSARRKEAYEANHVERLPTPPAAAYQAKPDETKRGYARFIHSVDRDVAVNAAPTAEETARRDVAMRAAPGERQTRCVSLFPLRQIGPVKIEVSALAGPGGASIPASAIESRVVRYKASNFTAVYTPIPKFLDPVPTAGFDLRPGVLRSLWFTATVPKDAKPGAYRGTVRIVSPDGADEVPLAIEVLPIALDEVAIPMGMFNMGPLVNAAAFDPDGEAYWSAIKRMCEDARAHGMTSLDPVVGMPLQRIENGKAVVDFSRMDRFMEIAKAAGFTQELNGYAIGTGLPARPGHDDSHLEACARQHGVADFATVVRAYFDAVREHAKAKAWLPIAFCLDDEYIVHPGSHPERLAAFCTLYQDNAPGFRFVCYDSSYLNQKQGAEREALTRMLGAIDTWCAGLHSPDDAAAVKAGGRRLWLYNTGMDRFTFGTYQFFARTKYDVSGFFQWTYNGTGTFVNHYFASHNEGHYGVVYETSRGLLASPTWERISEGCVDHRYLQTAWRLVGEAKKAGKAGAEAKALEQTIEGTFAKLRFGTERADQALAIAGEGRAENPYTPEGMDALRAKVADGIVALQKALGAR